MPGHRLKLIATLLIFLSTIPSSPLHGQLGTPEDVRDVVERFEETGSLVRMHDYMRSCDDGGADALIGALISREWHGDRVISLAAIFSAYSWEACPDQRIDEWLESRLRAAIRDPSKSHVAFRLGIQGRRAPDTESLWMSLATDGTISQDIRREALGRTLSDLSPDERMSRLLQNLSRDDLPSSYVSSEVAWLSAYHPEAFLDQLGGSTLARLPMPGARSIILTLGTLASGGNRATTATEATARSMLSAAVPLATGERLAAIEGALRRSTEAN